MTDKDHTAFPCTSEQDHYGRGGMSLREYFAAKAMVGLLTSTATDTQSMALLQESIEQDKDHDQIIAERSYHIADAMLEARSK